MRNFFKSVAVIFGVVAIVAALGFSDLAGAQGSSPTIYPAGGSDGPPNL